MTRPALLSLVLAVILPACDSSTGGEPAPDFHTTDALGDNVDGEGIGQCLGAPCGEGFDCAPGLDCVQGAGPGLVCAPPCDPAVPCGDEGDGVDLSCGIPALVVCAGKETPHCIPVACEADADCGDGVCLLGVCRPA